MQMKGRSNRAQYTTTGRDSALPTHQFSTRFLPDQKKLVQKPLLTTTSHQLFFHQVVNHEFQSNKVRIVNQLPEDSLLFEVELHAQNQVVQGFTRKLQPVLPPYFIHKSTKSLAQVFFAQTWVINTTPQDRSINLACQVYLEMSMAWIMKELWTKLLPHRTLCHCFLSSWTWTLRYCLHAQSLSHPLVWSRSHCGKKGDMNVWQTKNFAKLLQRHQTTTTKNSTYILFFSVGFETVEVATRLGCFGTGRKPGFTTWRSNTDFWVDESTPLKPNENHKYPH